MNTPMSMHSDVMKASPDTPEGKANLFQALKDRGGSEFKMRRLDCAAKLYARALKFAPGLEQKCTILSNLSLVHANMHNGQKALENAEKCIAANPKFAKGHFRKAQALVALKRIPESHTCFEKAAEISPDDKMLKKGVRLSKKRLASYVPEPEKNKAEPDLPAAKGKNDGRFVPKPKVKATSSSSVPSKKPNTASGGDEMRGYKFVNGKKTSYFHHEMTEAEKKLIGDITPQRIDPATQAAAVQPKVAEGMSEWNSKGTFEDRDFLPWAKQHLPKILVGLAVPCGSCELSISKVSDVNGLCSIAFIKAKKRFLFELQLTLDWEAHTVDADSQNKLSISKGTLKLEQLCHDDPEGDDLVPTYKATRAAAGMSDKQAIQRSVANRKGDLFKAIVARLDIFRRDFFAL